MPRAVKEVRELYLCLSGLVVSSGEAQNGPQFGGSSLVYRGSCKDDTRLTQKRQKI